MKRRNFILTASAAAISSTACSQGQSESTLKSLNANNNIVKDSASLGVKKTDIGFQTYSLRDIIETNPRQTLQMIKRSGYDYVELNSRNFELMPPKDLKSLLGDLGLGSPASHITLDMLDDLPALIKLGKIFECEYLIVPYISEEFRTLDHWRSHAQKLSKAGAVLRQEGIRLAYHNHDFEFDDLGGGITAMEILLGEAGPDVLDFQIDFFWTALANINIPDLFNQYSGRFKLCHIKDMGPNKAEFEGATYEKISKDLMRNVGEGVLDFKSWLSMNEISGLDYFIAEHDSPPKPYEKSLVTSYKAITEILN